MTDVSAFQHEAMFYSGMSGFVSGCTGFISAGLEAGEPVLVAVIPPKIEALRQSLGSDASEVRFVDMAEVGRNPARIIPVWRDFLDSNADRSCRARGIGEPIWATRTSDELIESQRHEALINLAFQDATGTILCPYDTESLAPDVFDEARASHPILIDGQERSISTDFRDLSTIARPFDVALSDPPASALSQIFDARSIDDARAFVYARSSTMGLNESKSSDLVLAVNEALVNSVRHGGGSAKLLLWGGADEVICQVEDSGVLEDPLAGRRRPDVTREGGYGLWIMNQLCDLVQVRSMPWGTVVRLRVSRR